MEWLFRPSYKANRDKELPRINITINPIRSCTYIPGCMTANYIRCVTIDEKHICMLWGYVLHGCSLKSAEAQKELQSYWTFTDKIVIIDEITMKVKLILIQASLQGKGLNQLYMNHMGILNARLLACESISRININADIEETV